MKIQPTKTQPSNMAIISLFNAIDREIKELLPYNIFIITRHYKRVKIQCCNRRVVANKKL